MMNNNFRAATTKTVPKQAGFTIIELMVATVVFTVILVGAMAGLLLVGRIYYKGVTNARLQEVNRSIVAEITQSIQFSKQAILEPSLSPDGLSIADDGGSAKDTGFFCIGQKRYTYALDRKVTLPPGADKERFHGLWADIPEGGSPCSALSPAEDITEENPCADGTCSAGRELLGENMRVARISIEEVTTGASTSTGLWSVYVALVYGDNDLIEVDDRGTPTDESDDRYICTPGQIASEFCAISELRTTVLRRIP